VHKRRRRFRRRALQLLQGATAPRPSSPGRGTGRTRTGSSRTRPDIRADRKDIAPGSERHSAHGVAQALGHSSRFHVEHVLGCQGNWSWEASTASGLCEERLVSPQARVNALRPLPREDHLGGHSDTKPGRVYALDELRPHDCTPCCSTWNASLGAGEGGSRSPRRHYRGARGATGLVAKLRSVRPRPRRKRQDRQASQRHRRRPALR